MGVSDKKPAVRAAGSRGTRSIMAALIGIILVVLVDIVVRYFLSGYFVILLDVLCFIVIVVLAIVLRNSAVKRFERRVTDQATQIASEYQQYMNQWETPYIMLYANLRIAWYNDAFRRLMKYQDCAGKTLEDLQIRWGNQKPDWDPISKQIIYDDKYYRAIMTQIRLRDSDTPAVENKFTQMYGLSLQDISREMYLEKENLDQQGVVALFYVDNYDQILSTMDENDRPILEAMIFRNLSDQAQELKGIMTKLERDRYMVVFPHKSLEILTGSNFNILEKIKKLESGDRYQATLSIGVGVDKSIEAARRYARSGVDLAMGRGGDQAVVKTKDSQQFFGGMSTTVESNTRVRARLIAYALKESIESSDQVLIMGHNNPDLDCLGAALGMYRVVFEMKKPVNIVISKDRHNAVDYLYNRVMTDHDHANVLVDLEDAIKICDRQPNTLLILVDVNRRVIVQYPELLDHVRSINVIDHHRTAADSVERVTISYVEPFASSASEMITELMQYIVENPPLTQVEADGLFAGIALDTKNFTVKTGIRTFEAAAYLRRKGADSVRVRKMFKNDMEDYKAKAQIVSDAEIIGDNMAIACWSSSLPNATTVAAQAADELLDIHGVQASFVLTEMDSGQVNISARSLGEINVQLIMEELNGGGHLSMAGAQLKDVSLEHAKEMVLDAIAKVTGSFTRNR